MNSQLGSTNARVFPAIFTGLLLASAAAALSADAFVPPIDLTGVVKSSEGPIEGAHVFIYTAGPRVGPGHI